MEVSQKLWCTVAPEVVYESPFFSVTASVPVNHPRFRPYNTILSPRAGEPWSPTQRVSPRPCLAGDVLDTFSFPSPLEIGDRLSFDDMAHYTMVKTTMFNGVQHPSIVLKNKDSYQYVREFSYRDFVSRLG